MESIQEIGRQIVHDAADLARQVTIRWAALAQDEPWLRHLTEIRQDHLPDLIRALARTALIDPESAARAGDLIEAARRHGGDRRAAGYDDSVIPAEYVLLRRSLRDILIRGRRAAPHLLLPTVARIELAMGTAEAASMHGYHAAEERSREADDARLLEEWSGLIHEVVGTEEDGESPGR